eukprot:14409121-Alexandrium_andersonii.AAC.1
MSIECSGAAMHCDGGERRHHRMLLMAIMLAGRTMGTDLAVGALQEANPRRSVCAEREHMAAGLLSLPPTGPS